MGGKEKIGKEKASRKKPLPTTYYSPRAHKEGFPKMNKLKNYTHNAFL